MHGDFYRESYYNMVCYGQLTILIIEILSGGLELYGATIE